MHETLMPQKIASQPTTAQCILPFNSIDGTLVNVVSTRLRRKSDCISADVKELWVKVQGTESEKEKRLIDLVQQPDFGTMFP